MFFNSGDAKREEGASLTSVLDTPTLRVELALLMLLCIDSMRSDLVDTFDFSSTAAVSPSILSRTSSASNTKSTTPDLIGLDEPSQLKTVPASGRQESRQEDESAKTQALRRSALTFFDKWRGQVMHRICDVLCVRGDTVRQAKAKRKELEAEAQRQRQGIASLIDFDEDPFASEQHAPSKQHAKGRYQIIESRLLALDNEKRKLILHCSLLLVLSLEDYTAQSRVLLERLSSSLNLETTLLPQYEQSVALGLLANAASQMDAEESTKRQTANDAAARRWKVGLAAVGGAVLIGVTGGLAAPLLAAGLGSVVGSLGLSLGIVGTYLGALASSSVLVGSLFGAYGAKMTGKLMERYAKEVQDFEFVPVKDPNRHALQRQHEWSDDLEARDPVKREQHRLRVCIGISGWLSSPEDVVKPWEVVDASTIEPFALRFELDAMLRLGNSLDDVLFSYAWDGLTYTVVSQTILGALYAGLWPLGLLKVASVLDNPFSVALSRADKAGKVLAHALIDGVQGKRPVSLIGYSIGARVIYSCLRELADQHAFGLVESAVLMGAPAPSNSSVWRLIRSVVASRVVNVYSTEDFVLGYLYRSTKLQNRIAGLHEIENVHGIENANVSDLVNGHDRYRYVVGTILSRLNFNDVCLEKVTEQERNLQIFEQQKQQKLQESKSAHKGSATENEKVSTSQKVTEGQATLAQNTLIDVFETQESSKSSTSKAMQPTRQVRTEVKPPAAHAAKDDSTTSPTHPLFARNEDQRCPLTDAIIPLNFEDAPSLERLPTSRSRKPIDLKTQKVSTLEPPRNDTTATDNKLQDRPEHVDNETRSSLQIGKAGTHVAVTEVLVVEANNPNRIVDDFESDIEQIHVYDYDADEVSSDFGELNMVEPVPMDDNDYGLM